MNRSRTLSAAVFALLAPGLAAPSPALARGSAQPHVYAVTSRTTHESALAVSGRHVETWRDSLGRELAVLELDAAGVDALARHVHEFEGRCGGFFAFDSLPEAQAFIVRDHTAEAIARPLGGIYSIDNQDTVLPWLDLVDDSRIHATIATLSAFQNRLYSSSHGRDAARWIADEWTTIAARRGDVTVELFEGCGNCSTQPSVILTVAGNELADEVVVIGAHLDSVSGGFSNPEQRAPGADDDASGIATVTEILRIALASGWQPRRTVKFIGYAAEEAGLRGSKAIAETFATQGINVVAVLQLDMTNYRSGVPYDLQIITDYANAALLAHFRALFDAYLAPRGFTRSEVACGYGCSDHASWTSQGYPAGMVFEAGQPRPSGGLGAFPYIHSTNDTLAYMGDTTVPSIAFAEFGLAFLGELAKTHVPEVDERIFRDDFELPGRVSHED